MCYLQALKPLGIGVATGEQCQNRVMFKQFLKAGALQFCQIDSCRLGGVSENVAVILMAKKYGGKQIMGHILLPLFIYNCQFLIIIIIVIFPSCQTIVMSYANCH
jgi:L-alanine-DL-glutamate epimerase-like enolase superfamily enzyme